MTRSQESEGILIRDQQRALYAYACVDSVKEDQRRDYKIAVNDLAANILRCGLCAALAAVQRLGERGTILMKHLAGANVVGLENATEADLARRVRELDVDAYMVATREMLKVAMWLRRACQATLGE